MKVLIGLFVVLFAVVVGLPVAFASSRTEYYNLKFSNGMTSQAFSLAEAESRVYDGCMVNHVVLERDANATGWWGYLYHVVIDDYFTVVNGTWVPCSRDLYDSLQWEWWL